MGKSLQLSGIIVVVVLLALGFVVGETLTELNNKVSLIDDNVNTELLAKISALETIVKDLKNVDNTELLTKITELEAAINAVESTDNSELLTKITELEAAVDAIESTDNTELLSKITELEAAVDAIESTDNSQLLARIAQLEAEVTALKEAGTNVPNDTIMLDQSGKYLSFEEIAKSFANKYFTGYVTSYDVQAQPEYGRILLYSSSSDLSNELILVRIYLLLQELSQYNQYLMYMPNINILYSYNIDDIGYSFDISIPSPILNHVDFTIDDVINETFGMSNAFLCFNFLTDESTSMYFDTVLLKEIYDGYISNNTFGNNLLTPLSN